MWYNGGDNKKGESKLAGKAAFNSDFNFNLYVYVPKCFPLYEMKNRRNLGWQQSR